MNKKIIVLMCILTLILCTVSVNAQKDSLRIEGEAFVAEVSNPAVADDANMSGGKFIGIDSVAGHVIIYDNIPASISFIANYRALGDGTLHVFIEKNGEFESLVDVAIEPTGADWGAPFLSTAATEISIPKGSKLKFTATGSISIDYFEFKLATEPETTNPSTGDTPILPYAIICIIALLSIKKRAFV